MSDVPFLSLGTITCCRLPRKFKSDSCQQRAEKQHADRSSTGWGLGRPRASQIAADRRRYRLGQRCTVQGRTRFRHAGGPYLLSGLLGGVGETFFFWKGEYNLQLCFPWAKPEFPINVLLDLFFFLILLECVDCPNIAIIYRHWFFLSFSRDTVQDFFPLITLIAWRWEFSLICELVAFIYLEFKATAPSHKLKILGRNRSYFLYDCYEFSWYDPLVHRNLENLKPRSW